MPKHLCKVCASAVALAISGAVHAEIEVSGYVKNETAVFNNAGQVTGQAQSLYDTDSRHHVGEVMKFENSARFFLNGDLTDDTTWHGDLNIITNTAGVNDDYQWHRSYTQQDWFRELYIDTSYEDWSFRIGKQQVVWGTADGIKLLDIINPTDWREFNQNTSEDARIPVWMINAERYIGDSGNIQLIISQHEESKFAGLNDKGDSGHPFIFKGVDTITGSVNGFVNIAPVFGAVAATFDGFARDQFPFAGLNQGGTAPTRVEDFITGVGGFGLAFSAGACGPAGVGNNTPGVTNPNALCLNELVQSTQAIAAGATTGNPIPFGGNQTVTNTIDGPSALNNVGGAPAAVTNADNAFWNVSDPDSTFEYVYDAAFGTFDSFVGLNSEYRRDYPDDYKANFGTRYKWTTDGGTNFSINYFYAYDPNPSVSVHYEDTTGQTVTPFVGDGVTANPDPRLGGAVNPLNVITLHDSAGNQRCSSMAGQAGIGATPGLTFNGANETGCTLVFEETVHRSHFIGASFDSSIDGYSLPWVLRGEFLYQKDARVPVIDRGELAIGNITEALKSEKADMFKYVIGLDTTVWTNLFVSTQFIQFVNLDYVDEASGRNAQINAARTANGSLRPANADFRRYTAHMPTLHLNNGFNAADKFESFVSLFFSRPFGDLQEHRWNNITIWEERGGFWNRFDFEYSFTDELIGTFEWNQYWGDENSMFGQFDESSNVQLGLRYLF